MVKDLDPDLDNIVLKALRKEPERRYASVQDLSEDLERFLKDLPVQARRETVTYRGRKFVKRNRALVIAAAAIILVMWCCTSDGAGANLVVRPDRPQLRRVKQGSALGAREIREDRDLGDPAPGGGSYTTYFQPWALNNRGDFTFASQVSPGSGDAVFLSRKEARPSVIALARPGEPAPGGDIFEGDNFGDASLNDSGDVAFAMGLRPLTPPELKGVQKGGLYRYSHVDGKLSAVVSPGVTAAPGFGVFQSTNQHATLNNRGDIVFVGIVRTTAGLSPRHIRPNGLGRGLFGGPRWAYQ